MAGNPFPLDKPALLEAYRRMRTIREFEERLHVFVKDKGPGVRDFFFVGLRCDLGGEKLRHAAVRADLRTRNTEIFVRNDCDE